VTYPDPHLKRILWYLIGGTKGGPMRGKILSILKERPLNANQLAEQLSVDYRTVQHHLKVLQENQLLVPSKAGAYGALYFHSPKLEQSWDLFLEIWSKTGKR
jgi:DNA-binding transcriptional ArsR family regulator